MTITIISDHETTEAITRHLRRLFPDTAGVRRRLTIEATEGNQSGQISKLG